MIIRQFNSSCIYNIIIFSRRKVSSDVPRQRNRSESPVRKPPAPAKPKPSLNKPPKPETESRKWVTICFFFFFLKSTKYFSGWSPSWSRPTATDPAAPTPTPPALVPSPDQIWQTTTVSTTSTSKYLSASSQNYLTPHTCLVTAHITTLSKQRVNIRMNWQQRRMLMMMMWVEMLPGRNHYQIWEFSDFPKSSHLLEMQD